MKFNNCDIIILIIPQNRKISIEFFKLGKHMEQIYTIPVNEAFEASAADAACGCAFCAMYNKLEENELELILGASMMEPDVRIKTN